MVICLINLVWLVNCLLYLLYFLIFFFVLFLIGVWMILLGIFFILICFFKFELMICDLRNFGILNWLNFFILINFFFLEGVFIGGCIEDDFLRFF